MRRREWLKTAAAAGFGLTGWKRGNAETNMEIPTNEHCGWIPNPDATRSFCQEIPALDAEIRELILASADNDVLLYKALAKYCPALTQPRDGVACVTSYNQGNIGSCVGHGTAQALNALYAVQAYLGECEMHAPFAADAAYGLAREAGGMLHERGDGCYGAAAAKSLLEMGTLYRVEYPAADLREYSVTRCRQFGDKGVGETLKTEAKTHLISNVVNCKTAESAWGLVGSGYPINVCSTTGFEMRRDAEGVCRASGRWSHSMAIIGRRTTPSEQKLFLIQNSWGNDWCEGPYWQDMPWGSFFATYEVVHQMLACGDSFAYYGIGNLKPRYLSDFGTDTYL
ncbi:MAG: C1 family peptidase [Thermoguttaceae bacterium]|nr:C1 family peptidase [Thermoguttaceae bacterium]